MNHRRGNGGDYWKRSGPLETAARAGDLKGLAAELSAMGMGPGWLSRLRGWAAPARGLVKMRQEDDIEEAVWASAQRPEGSAALKMLARGGVDQEHFAKALLGMARMGNGANARCLMELSDPKRGAWPALEEAAQMRSVELLETLLEANPPASVVLRALRSAASHGNAKMVKRLILCCAPTASAAEALDAAVRGGWEACALALAPVTHEKSAREIAKVYGASGNNPAGNGLVGYFKALDETAELGMAIDSANESGSSVERRARPPRSRL